MGERTHSEIVAELKRRLDPAPRRQNDPGLRDYLSHVPVIECGDGFKLSVQASRFHYCAPRESLGGWYQVEVGFPSERVEAFMPYIDGGPDEDPTETVYGYVPLEIVAQAILDHGGFSASNPKASPHV